MRAILCKAMIPTRKMARCYRARTAIPPVGPCKPAVRFKAQALYKMLRRFWAPARFRVQGRYSASDLCWMGLARLLALVLYKAIRRFCQAHPKVLPVRLTLAFPHRHLLGCRRFCSSHFRSSNCRSPPQIQLRQRAFPIHRSLRTSRRFRTRPGVVRRFLAIPARGQVRAEAPFRLALLDADLSRHRPITCHRRITERLASRLWPCGHLTNPSCHPCRGGQRRP